MEPNTIYSGDNGRLMCSKCAGMSARSGYDLSGMVIKKQTYRDNISWITDLGHPMKCESRCTVYPSRQETLKLLEDELQIATQEGKKVMDSLLSVKFQEIQNFIDTSDTCFTNITFTRSSHTVIFIHTNGFAASLFFTNKSSRVLWTYLIAKEITRSDLRILKAIAFNNDKEPIKLRTIKKMFE